MNLLETVFEWVVSTTVRASLVAVAIMAIQMLLRPWLPANWRHPLWIPLLLVMVLPFVPELPVHLIPARHVDAVNADPMVIGTAGTTTGVHEEVAMTVAPAPQKTALLPILWLAGVLVTMTAGITGYRRKLQAIRTHAVSPDPNLQAEIEEARKAAGLARTPLVWLSREVESPAVSGLLRPVLLLPAEFSATFTTTESRLILLHEFSHIKRHDLAQNWLLFALQALHWFNPVIWFAFARVRMDRETACDARVLALEKEDRRSDYGHALLKMQDLPAASGLRLGFLGILENVSGLRTRISDISRYRRSHPAWQVVGCLLVAVIALFGSTRAKEEDGVPAPKEEVTPRMTAAQAAIAKKLDTIIIPEANFQEATMEESIGFIRIRSAELDTEEKDPSKKGVNFVIRKGRRANGQKAWEPGRLTFNMKNVPLRRVLAEVAEQTGSRFKIDDFAITFMPKGDVDLPADPPAPQPEPLKGKAVDAAKAIIIPSLDVRDSTLTAVVELLNARAKESGAKSAPAIKVGPATKGDTKIQALSLRNVPLSEAVRYVAEMTKNGVSADDTSIQIGK
jgi:beta-lactamase regulating signal transducer with metallopeptidase domain